MSLPQFNIPKEITTYKMLKQFLAEKFGVTPDMVLKMGESFYSHIGMTQQRVHPFAIAAPPDYFKDPDTKFLPIYQYMLLWKSLSKEQHVMTTLARSYLALPEHMKLDAKRKTIEFTKHLFDVKDPDWSSPEASVSQAPEPESQKTPKTSDKDKKKDDAEGEELFPRTKKKPSAEENKKKRKKAIKEKKRRRLEGLEETESDDIDEDMSSDAQALDNSNKKRKKRKKKKRLDVSIDDTPDDVDSDNKNDQDTTFSKPKPQ